MNKLIKRFVGTSLAISAIGTLPCAKYLTLNTEVKAASTTDDDYGVKSVELHKGTSSSEIQLYKDSNYENKIKFDKDTKEYYAETTLSSINFNLEAEGGYLIKAFKSDKDTATAYESGDKISLGSGKTTLYIRTYEKGDFDADEVNDKVVKEYQITIERKDNAVEDDKQDKIYLNDIILSTGNVDFNKMITSYDVALETADKEITIKAKPENEDDRVTVNGKSVDDKYKRKVTLRLGQNEIKIKVKSDDDKERTYTLNILRGDENYFINSSNNESIDSNKDNEKIDDKKEDNNQTTDSNTSAVGENNNYKNQWIYVDGAWKYSDALGNIIKNTWFYDQNNGKEYYLKSDGSMADGWFKLNNSWYYLGNDGAKQTGWIALSGSWYYLDYNGVMKTGWFRDSDGKWYYLNNYGEMERDIVIDGYKLGIDGAMI